MKEITEIISKRINKQKQLNSAKIKQKDEIDDKIYQFISNGNNKELTQT